MKQDAELPRVRRRGFTLIETLVVVAVLAVTAVMATPSLVAWRVRDQVDARARALLSTLSYARSEAVRRGVRVTCEGTCGAMSKLRKLPINCPAGGVKVRLVCVPAILTAASSVCARNTVDIPPRSTITAQPHDQSATPTRHACPEARQWRAASTRHTVTRTPRRTASLRA
jgi:prepilin-type N-terminal cleavage/methylation domain-containing protein